MSANADLYLDILQRNRVIYLDKAMARIVSFEGTPFHVMSFANVDHEGRHITEDLPMHRATVDSLPEGIDGLIACSDLQGIEIPEDGRKARLLGLALADELLSLCQSNVLPPARSIGVLLCGDLFSHPDERGRAGDVREVITAFAAKFRRVVCVLGNHDRIGDPSSPKDLIAFRRTAGIQILDGESIEVAGWRVAGISGIIGKEGRMFRRTEEAFCSLVRDLAAGSPQVLLMHDGPEGPEPAMTGSIAIRRALEEARDLLVIRGHAHWETPLVEFPNGVQVLSVDKRVVVMMAPKGNSQ